MAKLQSTALISVIALMATMPAAVALPSVSVPDVATPDVSVPEAPKPELSVGPEFSVYTFTVEVTDGPLTGQQYDGSFCYPKDAVSGEGTESINEANGFKVAMNFFGNSYTGADDTGYADFPTLTLEDGVVTQLDFWIEAGDRIVWWDLPHWDVALSAPEDTADCAIVADTSIDEAVNEAVDF